MPTWNRSVFFRSYTYVLGSTLVSRVDWIQRFSSSHMLLPERSAEGQSVARGFLGMRRGSTWQGSGSVSRNIMTVVW
jgi:hypothetical protein